MVARTEIVEAANSLDPGGWRLCRKKSSRFIVRLFAAREALLLGHVLWYDENSRGFGMHGVSVSAKGEQTHANMQTPLKLRLEQAKPAEKIEDQDQHAQNTALFDVSGARALETIRCTHVLLLD